ncbi:MAG: hypothetical protein PVI03_05910 [Candidatus Thorarchaeota archaeon]|jgi:hypothetical protein
MYIKEYTIYVNEKDEVVKMVSGHVLEDVDCYAAMINLGDKVELIRVRDKE